MRDVEPGTQGTIPPKVYAVMMLTTALTFGLLTTAYQLLFARSPFA